MAAETLYIHKFDGVWMVPCGDREDKKARTAGIHRLNMTRYFGAWSIPYRLAVADMFPPDFPVTVSPIEVDNGTTIPTYFLMERLRELHASEGKEFHFVMGSDLIPTLKTWHEGEKLVSDVNFVLYNRVGYDIDQMMGLPSMPKRYLYAPGAKGDFGEVSSTEVRRRIAEAKADPDEAGKTHLNIGGLVTKSVIDYIRTHSLY